MKNFILNILEQKNNIFWSILELVTCGLIIANIIKNW
jgi:hypothetical protein